MNDEKNWKFEIGTLVASMGMCNLQIDNQNQACRTATTPAVYAGADVVGGAESGNLEMLKYQKRSHDLTENKGWGSESEPKTNWQRTLNEPAKRPTKPATKRCVPG